MIKGYQVIEIFDNGVYSVETTVAICTSFKRAILYLTEECGLNGDCPYYSSFTGMTTFKKQFGTEWLSIIIDEKISFFSLKNGDYSIEECEILE